MALKRYKVTKTWYDEEEIIESETELAFSQIRNRLDETRRCCDEITVEEIEDEN